MSLTVDGVWKAGVWATTVWADGVWREGAAPEPEPEVTDQGAGGGGRKKRRLPEWDITRFRGQEEEQREEPPPPAPQVYEKPALVTKAKEVGRRVAEEILASHKEIARIKTQMRLSSSDQAIKVLEGEIEKLEKHIAQVKAEEDFLLLTILM